MKFKDLPDEKKQPFLNLLARLSPENLCCDGEISKRETDKRYRQIMREWRILEVQVGFKVSHDEVEDYEVEQMRAEMHANVNFQSRLAKRLAGNTVS